MDRLPRLDVSASPLSWHGRSRLPAASGRSSSSVASAGGGTATLLDRGAGADGVRLDHLARLDVSASPLSLRTAPRLPTALGESSLSLSSDGGGAAAPAAAEDCAAEGAPAKGDAAERAPAEGDAAEAAAADLACTNRRPLGRLFPVRLWRLWAFPFLAAGRSARSWRGGAVAAAAAAAGAAAGTAAAAAAAAAAAPAAAAPARAAAAAPARAAAAVAARSLAA